MLNIYVDGDGCAVKPEVYKVADRYGLKTFLVANKTIPHPFAGNIEMIVVSGSFDAADDWIVEKVEKNDIVITADILLADRCIKKQARVLGPKCKEFTEDSIGSAVAMRELSETLRQMGEVRGGPAPMQPKDRSQFLATLDQIIQSVKRSK